MKKSCPATTVRCYDAHARDYDRYQRAVVPRYEEALAVLAALTAWKAPSRPRILDLGCGTGNASAAVSALLPGARFFLLDGAESMLAAARDKLGRRRLLGAVVADLSQSDWERALGGQRFDAVISSLVLEHLPPAAYRRCIVACRRHLSPGGTLLAIEGYDEPQSGLLGLFEAEMRARRRTRVAAPLERRIGRLRHEQERHYFTSIETKRRVWQKTGFAPIFTAWQYLCLALMVGIKPRN